MIFTVNNGCTISSTEYSNENEGIAIATKIHAGIIVQIISKVAA
jgi:hypothetical protein